MDINQDYILDDLTLWEARDLAYQLQKEIWRKWKAGERRDHLIDRYDELQTVIWLLEQQEDADV